MYTTVTVKAGDTLSSIAQEMFGDASRYPEIYQQNKALLDTKFVEHQRANQFRKLWRCRLLAGRNSIQRPEDCLFPGMELRVHVPPPPPAKLVEPVWIDANKLLQELEAYPPSSPVHYHELRDIIAKCGTRLGVTIVGGGSSPASRR